MEDRDTSHITITILKPVKGGIITPILLNLYLSDFPHPKQPKYKIHRLRRQHYYYSNKPQFHNSRNISIG